MMKMWKKMIALFSAACVLAACGASDTASDDQLTQIQEKGVIVIGTEGTYAPNSYHDEEGNLTSLSEEELDTYTKFFYEPQEFTKEEIEETAVIEFYTFE